MCRKTTLRKHKACAWKKKNRRLHQQVTDLVNPLNPCPVFSGPGPEQIHPGDARGGAGPEAGALGHTAWYRRQYWRPRLPA